MGDRDDIAAVIARGVHGPSESPQDTYEQWEDVRLNQAASVIAALENAGYRIVNAHTVDYAAGTVKKRMPFCVECSEVKQDYMWPCPLNLDQEGLPASVRTDGEAESNGD
jgi:hypothetical protein